MKTTNTRTENRLQEATQRMGARFMPTVAVTTLSAAING